MQMLQIYLFNSVLVVMVILTHVVFVAMLLIFERIREEGRKAKWSRIVDETKKRS
jgi:hypothetical protein